MSESIVIKQYEKTFMIKPLVCDKCGRTGYPAEQGFRRSYVGTEETIHCECGHKFHSYYDRDQHIMSGNIFVRLGAASNHSQHGTVMITPGILTIIKFDKSFDFIGNVFFTPERVPVFVKEIHSTGEEITIVSSVPMNCELPSEQVKLHWTVYGLVDVDALPTWFIHFYSAIVNANNRFWKPALLDYAVAFEIFMETFLYESLSKNFSERIAKFLLKKTWQIENRTKELLELAVDHRLTEDNEIYKPWNDWVREPRNRLSHGEKLITDYDDIERAHRAVYQAIRWIESLAL